MQRLICWVEKLDEGVKREVRVSFHGGRIAWQFKLSTIETWDYTSPPTLADWDALLEKVEKRYQRRNVAFKTVELTRRCREEALRSSPPNTAVMTGETP